MSDFARMQEAWEAALEGEVERSFRLADEAGVSVIDRAMARGRSCGGEIQGDGYDDGFYAAFEENARLENQANRRRKQIKVVP